MSIKLGKVPSIRRMPEYLGILNNLKKRDINDISTSYFAEKMGIKQINVKKDLDLLNVTGRTGVGYRVKDLIHGIEDFLGWNNTSNAVLLGAGNLGSALLGYNGFKKKGLNIVAAFDLKVESEKEIHGIKVMNISNFKDIVKRMHINIAVLTVPGEVAQKVADLLVDCGITGIWNFTDIKLDVPGDVLVQDENLASGLAELSVKIKMKFEQKYSEK